MRSISNTDRSQALQTLNFTDSFVDRHIGPRRDEVNVMLEKVGYASLDAFIQAAVPSDILLNRPLNFGDGRTEVEVLAALREIAAQNQVYRSFIGMGYANCITPPVIQRNILENPGWYTQYTPYQAEIAQGRLEALLNFQTMIIDLTGLPISNASLLDESTAAAEAMGLCFAVKKRDAPPRPRGGVPPVDGGGMLRRLSSCAVRKLKRLKNAPMRGERSGAGSTCRKCCPPRYR